MSKDVINPFGNPKFIRANYEHDPTQEEYWFHCPGCESIHCFVVKWSEYRKRGRSGLPEWAFNGDMDRPTFHPSLLYHGGADNKPPRCHIFLTAGVIKFLPDCGHKYAGKEVPLSECEDA